MKQPHVVEDLQANLSPPGGWGGAPHPGGFLVDVPVEEVFHQVQGGQVAVLMVDKLEQALVEEGGPGLGPPRPTGPGRPPKYSGGKGKELTWA